MTPWCSYLTPLCLSRRHESAPWVLRLVRTKESTNTDVARKCFLQQSSVVGPCISVRCSEIELSDLSSSEVEVLPIDHGRSSLISSPPNINDVARVTMSLLPALTDAANSLSEPRRITSTQLQITCSSLALLVEFGAIWPTKSSFGRDRPLQANNALPRSES